MTREQITEHVLAAVCAARREQIEDKGYDYQHDDEHKGGQLMNAAESYLLNDPHLWPWSSGFHGDDRTRQLVVAAALIVAEVERQMRAAGRVPDRPGYSLERDHR